MILTRTVRESLKKLQLNYLMSIYFKLFQLNAMLKNLITKKDNKFIYLDNINGTWYLISNLDCNEIPIHVPCSSLDEALYFYCRFYIEYILFKTRSHRRANNIVKKEIAEIWPEPWGLID